jgi:hypothetical protein
MARRYSQAVSKRRTHISESARREELEALPRAAIATSRDVAPHKSRATFPQALTCGSRQMNIG